MMRTRIWWVALGLLGLTAGCGDTALTQGLTGGAAGAAAGEVIADEPLLGAGVGAGAGILAN